MTKNDLKPSNTIQNKLKPSTRAYIIKITLSKANKSRTKSKSEFLLTYFQFNIFAYMGFFDFPNHILKLKALD